MEKLAGIKEIVKDLCFLLVAFLHLFQTAHFLQPFENFTAYVDAICIRCIIKGTSVCMCLIGKHGRCSRKNIFCDQILADNGDYHTCRSDVLLNAAIDNTIFAYINRLGKETGGYICHKCFALCIWKLFELGSINGVVLTDINIVCIRADRQIAAIRNVRESLILGRSNLVCFSVFLCFLVCFLCPLTGYNVVSHLIFHKVHWDHGKLLGSAALKEKYLIVVRNIHQLTKILLSCVNDFLECSTSVAHFHNGHAGTIVIHLRLLSTPLQEGPPVLRKNCTLCSFLHILLIKYLV